MLDYMIYANKKWKMALFIFYQHFKNNQAPVTVDELFNWGYSTLRSSGILTQNALRIHARSLAGRHYLYTIKNRKKPTNYPIPYKFMISKVGLERLNYEDLISRQDQEKISSYVRYHAAEHGVGRG